jgi:transcriptional regulator with XRE-family HTH domain
MEAIAVVAWNIRRLRVERGLSQEALAFDAEIDRTYVSRLERILENPTVAVLDRISRALSVRIVELFAEPKPGARPPALLRKGRRRSTNRRR